jgi:N-acetyl-anhydromuramyl-L-alanine amidase AmpD
MLKIEKYGKFHNFEKNKKKKQIILCHSHRGAPDYLNSLKSRNNGEYDKIPNYFITKEGKVINLISDDSYSNFFYDTDINKNSIIICLENLGWLEKKPLDISYTNWIGDIYKKEVFSKKWKGKLYWDNYSDSQYNNLLELCRKIMKKFSINNQFIGHNTKVEGVKLYNGIVCRSNYHSRFFDLCPSFNFDKFKNDIEYER